MMSLYAGRLALVIALECCCLRAISKAHCGKKERQVQKVDSPKAFQLFPLEGLRKAAHLETSSEHRHPFASLNDGALHLNDLLRS